MQPAAETSQKLQQRSVSCFITDLTATEKNLEPSSCSLRGSPSSVPAAWPHRGHFWHPLPTLGDARGAPTCLGSAEGLPEQEGGAASRAAPPNNDSKAHLGWLSVAEGY